MSTDSEIIRRSKESPAAFAELYDRHAAAIHRYASRRLGEAADDIMSETFLVAFERRSSFDESIADALPWLFGIATVLLRDDVLPGVPAGESMGWTAVTTTVVDAAPSGGILCGTGSSPVGEPGGGQCRTDGR